MPSGTTDTVDITDGAIITSNQLITASFTTVWFNGVDLLLAAAVVTCSFQHLITFLCWCVCTGVVTFRANANANLRLLSVRSGTTTLTLAPTYAFPLMRLALNGCG